ncbi:MAG: TRAP transporter TatT component family protein [Desulfobacterales bacterium]|nr:TRAP transporter TatT component family protein [Desulfobacterales bacterium]
MATEVIMKRLLTVFILVGLIVFSLSGCMRFALRLSPSLFPNLASSVFEECDPELAKMSIPSNLKLMEGLLKNDPGNKHILTALSMGFAGYSQLFVEGDDPARASALYERAREYGIRALGDKGVFLVDPQAAGLSDLKEALGRLDRKNFEALFWTTLSWNALISLNLDKPKTLLQMAAAEACLRRVLELDPLYLHALPHVLMGASLSARPPLLGGNPEQARAHFEAALKESGGKFFLTQVYFARYYAVRTQDKALFAKVLQEVVEGDPGGLKDVCLINHVMQQRAKILQKQMDDLFL